MRLRANLRLRVALGIALLTTLILSAHSVLLYSSVDVLEHDLINKIVGEEMQYFIDKYRSDPAHVKSIASDKLAGYVARSGVDPALPEYLRGLAPGVRNLTVNGAHFHVLVRDLPEGRFIVAYDTSHHEAREARFISGLIVGTLLSILVGAGLGYWAAGLLVRPVRDLAGRVAALDAEQPETSLAADYADEEVRQLAQALDGYRQKVVEFIRREQEFTANVSHELRTPLTAIRTSCELLLQEPALTEDARRRLATIDRSAVRLAETARALLFLARGGASELLEDVSVGECVGEAAEPLLGLIATKGLSFESAIDPSAVIRVDRHALYLLASNLLRNAVQYTDHGSVHIGYRDGRLTVTDTGAGIGPVEIPRLFDRYYRGAQASRSDGVGLGLAIVKRICERFGWTLDLESTLGSGTRVAVDFPLQR